MEELEVKNLLLGEEAVWEQREKPALADPESLA